jgi:aspartate aminotransferase-like enzyme
MYQPMYLTRDRFEAIARALRLPVSTATGAAAAASFLPGPVDVSDAVRQAFAAPPVSHRSDEFLREFEDTRASLRRLTSAPKVQVMAGAGTLANDIVAAQLSLERERGLVLAAGEFGDRLLDHARRARLDFTSLRRAWGAAIDVADVDAALAADPAIRWLWTVHCETSTGVLIDLPALKAICARRGVRLCLDAISSLGAVRVDLGGVHLASGSSGKGLRAYPGLCMVFHDQPVAPAPDRLPRALDLGLYADRGGVPFTLGSNLLRALGTAVQEIDPPQRFARTAEQGGHVRDHLLAAGFDVVAPAAQASPAVITIALAPDARADEIGQALARDGFHLAYQSDYLRSRNWIQIGLMGDHDPSTIEGMLKRLAHHRRRRRAARLTTAAAGPTTAACPPTTGSPSSGSSTSPSSSATSSGPRRSTAASSA